MAGAASGIICRQIVASVDDEASGPSYSVTSLAAALRRRGLDSAVMAVGRRPSEPGLQVFCQQFTGLPVAKRLMISGGLAQAIGKAAEQGSVLHSHGLWLMPNFYPARAAQRHRVPLLVSPRGMLGEAALAFSARRKRLLWALAQRRALEHVACFHATSFEEADDIRRVGLTAPVAVIPNGIEVTQVKALSGSRTILCLGRIHPKKGIDRLITAWAQLASRYPGWRLRIVGPPEMGYREVLQLMVKKLRVPRVDFDGPLYGDDKLTAYRKAGLFVLPSLNENFGMVVAEALAIGVPVISTKGAPWQNLEEEGCGWWIDHGPDAMEAALDSALALPDAERAAMGARGRAWMARDFGWDSIACRMLEVYAWCLGKGDRPDCVVMD